MKSTQRASAASGSGRWPACHSRSRTCSTSRACRRWRARRSIATARPQRATLPLIERLEAAGAVLVGALNMGEYAYDFTGENVHDGPTRNPHDPTRMTGGSSGGSAGRSPAGSCRCRSAPTPTVRSGCQSSLCGIFGLKPTYGRLSRARSFPFVASLDHLGPFARSVDDLALAYDAMQGPDPRRPGVRRPAGRARLPRIGQRHGRPADRGRRRLFRARAHARRRSPRSMRVAKALGATREIEIPEAARARAAAYVITATEGATLHLDRLRTRAARFRSGGARPADRRRHDAGALVNQAQKFRRWYRGGCSSCSTRSTPSSRPPRPARAPAIGQQTFVLDGVEMPVRPNIGVYTQPISFIGLPVAAVPVPLEPAAHRRADHRRAVARGCGAAHCARARTDGVAAAPRPKN